MSSNKGARKELEVWKDIKDYEGYYKVSNLGKIKNSKTNRILKVNYKSGDKYGRIILGKEGIYKGKYIHRLVAQAFLLNPNNYKEVNHKDENPKNNYANNLEWCDRRYNNTYGKRIEKVRKKLSISINQYNLQGQLIKRWESVQSAIDKYHNSHIIDCLKGKRKTANGYVWKYAEEDV